MAVRRKWKLRRFVRKEFGETGANLLKRYFCFQISLSSVPYFTLNKEHIIDLLMETSDVTYM